MTLPNESYPGPWLVRMAEGSPVRRAIEPILVQDLEQLEQALSGILSALSLLGPGEHLQISVDRTEP